MPDSSGYYFTISYGDSSTATSTWGTTLYEYKYGYKKAHREYLEFEEQEQMLGRETKKKKKKESQWYEAAIGKKRIEVFDFDDTIVQSAKRPDRGEPRHGWNGKDWWGSEASLSHPLFSLNDCSTHHPVVDAMARATQDNDTLTILLTGRRGVVAHMVRSHLARLSLYGKRIIPPSNKKALKSFQTKLSNGHDKEYSGRKRHHQFFCGDFITEDDYPKNGKGKPQHGTIYHKRYIVQKLMHKDIEELVMWDDRDDHIRPFIAMGLDLKRRYEKLESAAINRVFPIRENDGRNTCTIINMPIKTGMSY